jgi:hypothetical protein
MARLVQAWWVLGGVIVVGFMCRLHLLRRSWRGEKHLG